MTQPRPLVRCAIRGCPWRGRWEPGGHCPQHADDPTPRAASLDERRGDQGEPLTGRTTITADIPEHQLRALRRIATDQKPATP